MIVKKLEFTDVFAANCYFYIDEITKHGFVIDPSTHAEKLLELIKQNGWKIEKILLTHSHLDHIGAVSELAEVLNLSVEGHQNAEQYLSNPKFEMHFTDKNVLKNMHYLKDGDIISLSTNSKAELKVISTPGHTLDSVVYYDALNNLAFTGDTIFQSGIGRTDIEGSGGNYLELLTNIKNKILTLPSNTVLYPGHGDTTTVQAEKEYELL